MKSVHKWFVASAGVALAITGLGKLSIAFGSAGWLSSSDPISGLPIGSLLLTVGTLELMLCALCFVKLNQTSTLFLITWLASSFLLYRIGLWWIGWQSPCNCFGSLTSFLQVPPSLADAVARGLLVYLLLGSYGLLFWRCVAATSSMAREQPITGHSDSSVPGA
ncbi:hypothetical protein SDC9_167710 [bioreactor metagenome]|uniref:Methylamine utilization protein MauE n=1 Tax=bioreactor metagenome TaxID=1076179 RepID=A0A645G311_9ZZZZ